MPRWIIPFFHARNNLHQKKEAKIPTYIDTTEEITNINFLDERAEVEIDAVNYPIEVLQLEGNANFVGIFGLTGEFEGWFSNDIASIPIKARLKVILGNIRVELRRWNRENWIPPQSITKK